MYSLVLFTVADIAITGLMMRQPLKVDILRDRASLCVKPRMACWKIRTISALSIFPRTRRS